jgi:hypothetical protein
VTVHDEEELEPSGPTRRTVLRAGATGALGIAAWSVPTIRPIARTASPGSKPPPTTPASVLASDTTRDSDSDDSDQKADGTDALDVSGAATAVQAEPDFTG